MAQAAAARTKINTKVTQPAPGQPSRRPAGRPKPGRPPKGPRVSGDARESVRQPDRPVIELEFGILVYPPGTAGEPWRAVFTENGQRKFRQGATEAKLAAKLEKVRERLGAGAVNTERTGAELIAHYLDPDLLSVGDRSSRKHAHTQRRLCERFAAPVIGAVTCQDIKIWHTQQIVNAAPTAGEGERVRGMLSARGLAGAPHERRLTSTEAGWTGQMRSVAFCRQDSAIRVSGNFPAGSAVWHWRAPHSQAQCEQVVVTDKGDQFAEPVLAKLGRSRVDLCVRQVPLDQQRLDQRSHQPLR